MKKYIFFAFSLFFAGIFFWQINSLPFDQLTFYVLMDQIFTLINGKKTLVFGKYFLPCLFLINYLFCLIYLVLLDFSKKTLAITFLVLEIILYLLLPKLSFYVIGGGFALGSLMLVFRILNYQKNSMRLAFFNLAQKAISRFLFYVILVLCLHNFFLIRNTPFTIPTSALETVLNQIENSLLEKSVLNNADLNSKICEQEGINQDLCLQELAKLMQTDDLNQLAEDLGHLDASEINLNEIVNLKMQELLEPYQTYIPYVLTLAFFSTVYFFSMFLTFFGTLFVSILHFILLKTGVVKIDIREIPQEYLT